MKILQAPHKTLTTASKSVIKINNGIKKLIKNMELTLLAQKDPLGVGLSAPQVGILLRIFILKPEEKLPIEHFINPLIVDFDNKKKIGKTRKEEMLEGCLSIPKTWATVDRKKKVKVRFLDINGLEKEQWFDDLPSVAVQHEIDHLDGILFTQRALEQGKQVYKEVNGKLKPLEI